MVYELQVPCAWWKTQREYWPDRSARRVRLREVGIISCRPPRPSPILPSRHYDCWRQFAPGGGVKLPRIAFFFFWMQNFFIVSDAKVFFIFFFQNSPFKLFISPNFLVKSLPEKFFCQKREKPYLKRKNQMVGTSTAGFRHSPKKNKKNCWFQTGWMTANLLAVLLRPQGQNHLCTGCLTVLGWKILTECQLGNKNWTLVLRIFFSRAKKRISNFSSIN